MLVYIIAGCLTLLFFKNRLYKAEISETHDVACQTDFIDELVLPLESMSISDLDSLSSDSSLFCLQEEYIK